MIIYIYIYIHICIEIYTIGEDIFLPPNSWPQAPSISRRQGAISSCFAKLPEQEAAELAGEARGGPWRWWS